VQGLTTTQLNAISTASLDALTVANLSTTQVKGLSAATIGNLTTTQVGALTTGQVAALTATEIGALTTAEIQGLSAGQLGALTSTQLGGLTAATVDANGTRHDEPLAAPHQVVSANTASQVNSMLQGVVNGGTGVKAKLDGYATAGKTGTARKPPYDKPPYKYVASFAGFAPADSPQLAAIVVLDEPSGGQSYFASDVAAPVFKQVMQYALTTERIAPNQPVSR